MNLIRTSALSFIAAGIKIAAGLVINKAVAVFIGPSGLALIGQFQNFMQLAMIAAQGAINTGITKHLAEYGRESRNVPVLLSTAIKISVSTSLLVALCLILFSNAASSYFLKSEDYAYVFIVFGFSIGLLVLNGFLLSVLNGLKEINLFISINITQSICGLVFSTILIYMLRLDGALIALVTYQSIVLVITVYLLRKHPIIRLENFRENLDKSEAKKLFKFAAMAITTAVAVPISHLVIRNYIGETLGWEKAGNWQAVWQISNALLIVVSTSLSIYYLPRLAELSSRAEIRAELYLGYKVIIPILLVVSVVIYLMRDFIIWFLYSNEFLSTRELFFWQLIGGVIKIASWLLSYLMVAKAMTRLFITYEIVFAALFAVLSILLVDEYGLIGTTYAFALNYLLYFFALLYPLKKYLWA